MQQALDLAVDHLSLYQLTIEEGTAFGDRYAAGKLRGCRMMIWRRTCLLQHKIFAVRQGFQGYEVSNHARPGCESIHNLIYWRYGDYAGIGPGAHGRLTLGGQRFATETPLAPAGWLTQVRRPRTVDLSREPLSSDEQLAEFLLMGMRLREGVDVSPFAQLQSDKYIHKINGLVDMGMIEYDAEILRLTPQGAPVLNAVLRALLDD